MLIGALVVQNVSRKSNCKGEPVNHEIYVRNLICSLSYYFPPDLVPCTITIVLPSTKLISIYLI